MLEAWLVESSSYRFTERLSQKIKWSSIRGRHPTSASGLYTHMRMRTQRIVHTYAHARARTYARRYARTQKIPDLSKLIKTHSDFIFLRKTLPARALCSTEQPKEFHM